MFPVDGLGDKLLRWQGTKRIVQRDRPGGFGVGRNHPDKLRFAAKLSPALWKN
jgi:hypothetical protein